MSIAVTNHDLGSGWTAELTIHPDKSESLVLTHIESDNAICLDAAETAKLRAIFVMVDESVAVAHANSLLDSVAADLGFTA